MYLDLQLPDANFLSMGSGYTNTKARLLSIQIPQLHDSKAGKAKMGVANRVWLEEKDDLDRSSRSCKLQLPMQSDKIQRNMNGTLRHNNNTNKQQQLQQLWQHC